MAKEFKIGDKAYWPRHNMNGYILAINDKEYTFNYPKMNSMNNISIRKEDRLIKFIDATHIPFSEFLEGDIGINVETLEEAKALLERCSNAGLKSATGRDSVEMIDRFAKYKSNTVYIVGNGKLKYGSHDYYDERSSLILGYSDIV